MTGSTRRDTAGLGFEIQTRLAGVGNYNAWIAEQFRSEVGRRVLDVGCALGNITQFFLDRELVVGLDVAADFVAAARDRYGANACFRAVHADAAEPDLPSLFTEDAIDTVLCVNVLEHIEDDVQALRNFAEILVPGGRLCLLVPALPALYGTMDKADDHFRRYTRRLLRARVAAAGFTITRLRFMNLVGIAGWALNGKILRKTLIPEEQYGFYDRLVPVISAVERLVPPPVGLSLVCIAHRPA